MSSTLENKILNLQERLRAEKESRERDRQTNDIVPGTALQPSFSAPTSSPVARRPRQLGDMGTPTRPKRQLDLPVLQMVPPKAHNGEFESKLQEIMKQNGILNIDGQKYQTEMKDLEHLGELGNGTCGHVVKMRHKPSGVVIAVKQMRRSGNAEENKRIIMDLDVVLKSHDCPYIVQCLGCFITESDVWICMELMATCLDKLLKKCRQAIPEDFLGKVTVATVKALSYLKEKHGVIHRDVKPSNILLDEMGGVKLCDFGISGRLVDSKAKTRSAGCAAYMAPERIDPPDPTKPDYDIRADVWSLGITLVELATGVFPYRDCKTDFEVLSRVVQDDPPALPTDAIFTKEFRAFVTCCLTKNYKHRPKYHKLMEHAFIRKYDTQPDDSNSSSSTNSSSLPTSGCQWFGTVMRQLEPSSRLSGGQQQQPKQQQQQQQQQPQQQPQHNYHQQQQHQQQQQQQLSRPTGHVSLKQTAHLRTHSELPAFMKSNVTKDHGNSQNSTNLFAYHQRSSSENNAANYLPYSPYASKRKDATIPRPFSPPANKDSNEPESSPSLHTTRPFSPWRQHIEHTSREYATKRCTTANGQAYADGRSYGSYRHDATNATESNARPYSPYHGRWDDNRDNSGTTSATVGSGNVGADRWQNVSRSLSPFARDYSPWRRENVDPPGVVQPIVETGRYSPFVQHRLGQLPPAPLTHPPSQDIYGSPMVSRKRFPSEPPPQGSHGSTSPQLLISRFAHQLKQDPPVTAAQNQTTGSAKESAKKRFASYVRLRLGGERAPSPEPPPRMNRVESPLAVRRNTVEQPSPSFPRRYVSPSPPQPPPRRLSESSSVPGSPQYVRARLRYTPEPQRRPPPP